MLHLPLNEVLERKNDHYRTIEDKKNTLLE